MNGSLEIISTSPRCSYAVLGDLVLCDYRAVPTLEEMRARVPTLAKVAARERPWGVFTRIEPESIDVGMPSREVLRCSREQYERFGSSLAAVAVVLASDRVAERMLATVLRSTAVLARRRFEMTFVTEVRDAVAFLARTLPCAPTEGALASALDELARSRS